MRDVEALALAFDRACRQVGARYAFIGGVAVLAWGQPRATMDVDALVDLHQVNLQAFVAVLDKGGLQLSESDMELALHERSHATKFDSGSVLHVDLKFATSEAEREEVDSAIEVRFGSSNLRIARPEDVVVFKIKFGSPQDLADARSILERQGTTLDEARLLRAARRLKVSAKLRKLRKARSL